MAGQSPVKELRIAVTVENYDEAVRFYRDAFGLPALEEWNGPEGRGVILDAGRATLELLSSEMAAFADKVEAGGHPSGKVRLAIEVPDSAEVATRLEKAGARRIGGPVVTPWNDRNVRLEPPGGIQLTLFTVLPKDNKTG